MAFTVRDLLAAPQLRLTLIGGESGLGNRVQWAHTCDLPDPWNWVGENQVLLTNGPALPESGSQQVEMLKRLHRAGVAACGVGDEMGAAPFSEEAVDTAEHLGIVLFAVPYPLPFMAIAQTIADATTAENARRVQSTASLYGLIASGQALPQANAQLLTAVANLTGFNTFLADAHCLHHWRPEDSSPEWMTGARPLSGRGSDGVASLWENSAGEIIHALPIRTVPDCMAFFHPRTHGRRDATLLLHAASVIGTIVGQEHLALVNRNRQRVEFVDRILNESSRLSSAAEFWIRQLGYEGKLRGAVFSSGTPIEQDALVHRLHRHGVELVASIRSGRLLAIIRSASVRDDDALLELLHHTHGETVHIGLGREVDPADIRSSLREAIWALEVPANAITSAQSGTGCESLHVFDPEQRWMSFSSPDRADAFVESRLGPLLSGELGHRDLLHTLRTYFECSRSPQATADAMHVHRQTVNQRLRRIETLVGRSLKETETVAELWLALRLYTASARPELG